MLIKVIVGILIAAGIGGGAWFVATHPAAPAASNDKATATEEASSGTFADLMARVGSWKCDARADYEGGASEGTVYMDGGKVRGDFVASISGRSINTSFVSEGGYIYTWSDVLPQGMKVKVDAAAGTAGGQGIDPSTPVKYSCEVWIAEQDKFTLPSDIEFFEIGTKGMGGFSVPQPN